MQWFCSSKSWISFSSWQCVSCSSCHSGCLCCFFYFSTEEVCSDFANTFHT
jgi:hypothetical protein